MVPNGWTLKELQTIISGNIKNGFSPVASDDETGYWVLGLGALSDDGIKTDEIKPVEPTKKVIESLLSKGDFLVSRSNTPDKVGRSIQYRGEINNCSYPDLMMKFRVDEAHVYPLFVEQQLKSSVVRAYFKMCASGSSKSMVKINKKVLEKTPLLVPPLVEQQKIAKILSTWDKAISTTERLIENSKQQKRALMQQLLTGKKRLLDGRGKRFECEWETYKLAQICSINKGKQINRSTLSDIGSYPVINGGITPSGYTESSNTHANTITISEGGNSCGFVGFQNDAFWCGGHCYALQNVQTNNLFLYQFLKFIEPKIMALRVGSGLPNIQKKEVETVEILLPSHEEQQKIATVLTNADKEIELLEQQLADLQQEKKALMQVLLTGKRRVTLEELE